MKVPQHIQDVAHMSRLFYFSLHAIGFLILVYLKSDLQLALKSFDVLELTSIFGRVILASYFFMVCGENPGQHYQGPLDKIVDIELGINSFKDELQSFDEKIKTNRAHTIFNQARQGIDNPELRQQIKKPCNSYTFIQVLIDQRSRQSKQLPVQDNQFQSPVYIASPKSSSSLDVNSGEEEETKHDLPEKRHCNHCHNVQPYRTKHCSSCQRCIPKYDHHCFWIGGCVGELNHRQFWAFLSLQSWVNWSAFFYNLNALDNYSYIDPKTGQESFERPYFILFAMAFVTFCFTVFTMILALYHTMLLSVGQTTWEQTKRNSITYLKSYPKYYNPFDYGLVKNFKIAFCHNNQLRDWELPTYQEAKVQAEKQFNCLENEYYSCC